MKAVNENTETKTRPVKKVFDIVLSALLVGLICIPIPAVSALAEEADGQEIEAQSEQSVADAYNAGEMDTDASADDVNSADEQEPENTVESASVPDDEATINAPSNDTASDSDVTAVVASKPEEALDAAPRSAEPTDTATSNVATVSSAKELASALSDTNTDTIELSSDFTVTDSLNVPAGRSVMLNGMGHTVVLDGTAGFTVNGTLTLNGVLTIEETGTHSGSMFTVPGGTLNMNSGVTLEGNGNLDERQGGGVSMSAGATFNMTGGIIENFEAHQGGGVFIADSRPRAISTFTMSGDALIRNNVGTNVGGGVYVGVRSVFTMEGNASVVDNYADAAGGVMNYGQSTLTTVYNNTTKNGAADIFNFSNAMLKLSPTNPDWVLKSTGTHVTGWYVDNYHATDGDGNQGNGQHRWNPALDDNVEYTPTDSFAREQLHLIAGAPLPAEPTVDVIWENEDGTVLYKMDDVKESEIPEASEYNTLSGYENPTEPAAEDGYEHEFTGWIETHPTDGEVVYIANYKLIAPDDSKDTHTLTIHYVDEDGNQMAPDYTEAIEEGNGYDVVSPHVDGYEPETDEVTGTAEDGDIEKTVIYHKASSTVPNSDDGNTNATDNQNGDDGSDGNNGGDTTDKPEMTPEEAVAHYGTPGDNARTVSHEQHGVLQQTGDEMGYAVLGTGAVAMAAAGILVLVIAMRKREQ